MSDQPTNGMTAGEIAQEILNRIVTDADFRQQVADNPAEALAQAGYAAGDDVSGYSLLYGGIALGVGTPVERPGQGEKPGHVAKPGYVAKPGQGERPGQGEKPGQVARPGPFTQ